MRCLTLFEETKRHKKSNGAGHYGANPLHMAQGIKITYFF